MKVSKNYLLILFIIIFLYGCNSTSNNAGGNNVESLSNLESSNISTSLLYVANTSDVVICSINESDGNLENCHNNPINVAGISELQLNLNGIAVAGQYAYLADVSQNLANPLNPGNFIRCLINGSGDLVNCQVSQGNSVESLNYPSSVTVNNSFIYITNNASGSSIGNGNIMVCPIDPLNESNELNNCSIDDNSTFYTAPSDVVINKDYAYIPDAQLSTVTKCSLAESGSLSGCNTINNGLFNFDNNSYATIANNYAYFTDSGQNGTDGDPESSVTSCTIEADSGNLTNCQNSPLPENYPQGIAIYNNRAYISDAYNFINHITICGVVIESGALQGTLQQCKLANTAGASLHHMAQVKINTIIESLN